MFQKSERGAGRAMAIQQPRRVFDVGRTEHQIMRRRRGLINLNRQAARENITDMRMNIEHQRFA